MPARLTFHLPDRPTRAFLAREGTRYLIGRDRVCDVHLDDDRVSRRHARLEWVDGGWEITDLGSKNGISVGGRRIDSDRLTEDAWMSVGGLLARFEIVSADQQLEEREWLESRWRTSVELQRDLTPAVGLEQLLARVLRSVLQLSEAERGLVLLADADGRLEIAARETVSDDELASSAFSGSAGAIERAVETGQPVVTSDALAESGLGERPSIVDGGIRGLACIPLETQGRLIGVIYVDSTRPGVTFGELDLEILEGLSSHAALAISVARLDEELKGLAGSLPTRVGLDPETSVRLQSELSSAWDRSLSRVDATPLPERSEGAARGTWADLVGRHLTGALSKR